MDSMVPYTYSPFATPFNTLANPSMFNNTWNSWMKPMEKMMRKFEHDFNSDELMNLRPSNFEEHRSLTNPIIEDSHGNRKMKLCFDLCHYKPEEVEIKTEKGMMTVCAKHESKKDDHYVCRMYSRSFTMPKDVKATEMKATFSPEGLLTVEAPMPPSPKQKSLECPMSRTLPVKHV